MRKIFVILACVIVIAVVTYFVIKRETLDELNPGNYFFPGNGYYQYFPPSTKLERKYYTCAIENDCLSCDIDDDAKVRCLEACRIKTFKASIPDRVDLLCQDVGNPYKSGCMERTYADYRYA